MPQGDEEEDGTQLDVKVLLKEAVKRATNGYLEAANKKRKDNILEVGSLAWVYSEESLPSTAVKLNRKWRGPFKIVTVVDGGRAYQLENVFDGTKINRAAEKLKPYVDRSVVLDKIEEQFLTAPEENVVPTDKRARKPPERLRDYVV